MNTRKMERNGKLLSSNYTWRHLSQHTWMCHCASRVTVDFAQCCVTPHVVTLARVLSLSLSLISAVSSFKSKTNQQESTSMAKNDLKIYFSSSNSALGKLTSEVQSTVVFWTFSTLSHTHTHSLFLSLYFNVVFNSNN